MFDRTARCFVLCSLLGAVLWPALPLAHADTSVAPTDPSRLVLAVEGGLVHTSDSYGGPAESALIGVDADLRIWRSILVTASLRDEIGSAGYLATSAPPGSARLSLSEQRSNFDFAIGDALELGARDLLIPSIGERYLHLGNSVFPSYLFGPRAALEDVLRIGDRLSLTFGVGYTYGLAASIPDGAALGAPRNDVDGEALVDLRIGERTILALGYSLEILTFQYDTRRYDGFVTSIGRSF